MTIESPVTYASPRQLSSKNYAMLIEIASAEWFRNGSESVAIDFYVPIIARLESTFNEPFDELPTIALMHVLTGEKITFRDGFVINGETDQENLMGISDAAIVVSVISFCPDLPWPHWKAAYSAPGGRLLTDTRNVIPQLSIK